MGVVGWGSPLLLIFCILGWGLGVHVFRLLEHRLLLSNSWPNIRCLTACSVGAACASSYAGAKAVHIPLYTVPPAPLFLHY